MDKLPKVFAAEVKEGAGNNRSYSYEKHNDDRSIKTIDDKTIEQKVHAIFSSENYIYKANVIIIRNSKKESKRLIGFNQKYVITYDNEQIPISEIEDIYLDL